MTIKVLGSAKKNLITQGIFANLTEENDIEVVGVAGDHFAYLHLYAELKPDVVLLCGSLNGQKSLGLIREMVDQYPEIKVISITNSCSRNVVLETMHAGARGYVSPSNCDFVELLLAIRTVVQGSTYICQAALGAIDKTLVGAESLLSDSSGSSLLKVISSELGAREEQVLRLLAEGYPSKAIAQELSIATSTVEVHRRNIMDKTGLRNIADLTRYAIRSKLVEL